MNSLGIQKVKKSTKRLDKNQMVVYSSIHSGKEFRGFREEGQQSHTAKLLGHNA